MNDTPMYANRQSGHIQNMMIGVSSTLVGTTKSRVALALLTNETMMPFPSSLDLNKILKRKMKFNG